MNEPKILKLETLPEYRLKLHYSTNEIKVFDVTPYIKGSFMGMLKDEVYFSKVRLYPNGEGIEWPDGQDLAPHELYEASTSSN